MMHMRLAHGKCLLYSQTFHTIIGISENVRTGKLKCRKVTEQN